MLTINNLSAGYGKVQVLHGISIDVPKGKVVTLIGSNGAGKTTTMRWPFRVMSPPVGAIIPEMARIVVVLPAPFEPMRVTTLPLGTSIEMPCRTCTLP